MAWDADCGLPLSGMPWDVMRVINNPLGFAIITGKCSQSVRLDSLAI